MEEKCNSSGTEEEEAGCVQGIDDFHGIFLTLVAYKAMCSVVNKGLVHMVEEKQLVTEEQGARFQEGKMVQRPTNDIGIARAVESSVRKGDVCQFHRL